MATRPAEPRTLFEFYTSIGESLPTVAERALIYEAQGLGTAESYRGTAAQNTALLEKLNTDTSPGGFDLALFAEYEASLRSVTVGDVMSVEDEVLQAALINGLPVGSVQQGLDLINSFGASATLWDVMIALSQGNVPGGGGIGAGNFFDVPAALQWNEPQDSSEPGKVSSLEYIFNEATDSFTVDLPNIDLLPDLPAEKISRFVDASAEAMIEGASEELSNQIEEWMSVRLPAPLVGFAQQVRDAFSFHETLKDYVNGQMGDLQYAIEHFGDPDFDAASFESSFEQRTSKFQFDLLRQVNSRLGGGGDKLFTAIDIRIGMEHSNVSFFAQDNGADTSLQARNGHRLAVIGDLDGDILLGGRGNDVLVGQIGPDVLKGNGGNDFLQGGAGRDRLTGGDGQDFLSGGSGADVLSGGRGNDTYLVDSPKDALSERRAEGSDTVISRLNYTLRENFENLVLDGGKALNGIGNSLRNTLTGNSRANSLDGAGGNDELIGAGGADKLLGRAGNDVLSGDAGDDILDGGAGSDTARYRSAKAGVTVNLSLTSTQNTLGGGRDLLIDIENVIGSARGDKLTGNRGDNVLHGMAGSDRLFGGAGNDTLEGGAGNDRLEGGSDLDTLSYVDAARTVTVNLRIATIQDTRGDGRDTLRGFENLVGSNAVTGNIALFDVGDVLVGDAGANHIEGLAGADVLVGGGGRDVLLGGTGNDFLMGDDPLDLNFESIWNFSVAFDQTDSVADEMIGGSGDDIYFVTHRQDSIVESSGGGHDLVITVVSYTLPGQVEDVYQSLHGEGVRHFNSNIDVSGNALDNVIYPNAGNNVIKGNQGIDTVNYSQDGFGGAVTVDLAITTRQFTGGSGYDTLLSIENVTGGVGDDSLRGNGKNNVLDGFRGADALFGGAGRDIFVLSEVGVPQADVILDFRPGTDTIKLVGNSFSAALGVGTLDADAFRVVPDFFTNQPLATDRLVYMIATGELYFSAEAGAPRELVCTLSNFTIPAFSDFVVGA